METTQLGESEDQLHGITESLGDQPLRFACELSLCNLPHDCSKLQVHHH